MKQWRTGMISYHTFIKILRRFERLWTCLVCSDDCPIFKYGTYIYYFASHCSLMASMLTWWPGSHGFNFTSGWSWNKKINKIPQLPCQTQLKLGHRKSWVSVGDCCDIDYIIQQVPISLYNYECWNWVSNMPQLRKGVHYLFIVLRQWFSTDVPNPLQYCEIS